MDRNPTGKPVSLEEVFNPRGVAVVGVSAPAAGGGGFSFGGLVVLSLIKAGFPAVYPINPKYPEILGIPCYPNLLAVPGPVDHVVVNIPAESCLALLDECAAKGVRSVHFFTAGFGESGEEDRAALERAMLDKARDGGFRIIGPNCIGLFVPGRRVANSIDIPLDPGPVAFVTQSGGHAQILPKSSGPRGIRFSKVVSYGNALDVNECELLEYFAGDDETEIIAAYVEGVRDGEGFARALAEAARRKPVIVYKGGKTEAGLRAALGHTASMTSSVAVFEALCRQTNAIQVDHLDEMIDVLTALRFAHPLPAGAGAAMIGAGGGPAVLGSDELERAGLSVPRLLREVQEELKRHLPIAGSIFTNPVDTLNLIDPRAIDVALRTVGSSPDIHMLVYHLGFHPVGSWGMGRFSARTFLDPVTAVIRAARDAVGKPVLIALRPPEDLEGMKEFLAAQEAFVAAGLPVFHSLRGLAGAMSRIAEWKRRKDHTTSISS
ncbi:MAG: CoA-binding protein [Syntrophales bacterium]|nr:CoA-binding protein [Syntrophales bacterium]